MTSEGCLVALQRKNKHIFTPSFPLKVFKPGSLHFSFLSYVCKTRTEHCVLETAQWCSVLFTQSVQCYRVFCTELHLKQRI